MLSSLLCGGDVIVQISVASCPDLTLRIYSEHFELIDTVHITATVLRYRSAIIARLISYSESLLREFFVIFSLAFNETTSELYTGGVGMQSSFEV